MQVKSTKERRISKDFSNKAVLVMLTLLIVVSVISVLFYFNTVSKAQPQILVNSGKALGEVGITILPRPVLDDSASGDVGITVVKPGRSN